MYQHADFRTKDLVNMPSKSHSSNLVMNDERERIETKRAVFLCEGFREFDVKRFRN